MDPFGARPLLARRCQYVQGVDLETARWVVGPDAAVWLDTVSAWADPDSLAAATRLRRDLSGDQAAAVLGQVALRRKARRKFGDRADQLFFTSAGLEQATRSEVATWRARRLVAAGVTEIVDLGCGIGADALAMVDAGIAVTAVEADPATAVLAQANLGGSNVRVGDALELADELLTDEVAVFADPARRTSRGRTWRVSDFSPDWNAVLGLLEGRIGCVKAAPGLPGEFLPASVATTWVSHRGDLVEASLWSGSWEAGSRAAVVLPGGLELAAGPKQAPPLGPLARFVLEPDPAVIRSGALAVVAEQLSAWALTSGIAYLSSDTLIDTPYAASFEVQAVLPYSERELRAWLTSHQIGTVEIKVRGVDVDPAQLRRRLKPRGPGSVTVITTPIAGKAAFVVCERC